MKSTSYSSLGTVLAIGMIFPAVIFSSCGKDQSQKLVAVSSLQEAWNAKNDPLLLADQFETSLTTLPVEGRAEAIPWTDTYWPSYRGGLADRWNSATHEDGFSYPILQKNEITQMTTAQLSELSPAEKYDIFIGNYDFSLLRSERRRTSPNDESWFGLCHGWAPAAIAFKEPSPVSVVGAGGVEVPFGSSDIKALLTYLQQYQNPWDNTRFLGERCNENDTDDTDSACRDVNAGSFHIIMANIIGVEKRAFVADISRRSEVWNQPVFGFKSQIIDDQVPLYESAAPGTDSIALVRSSVEYISEMPPHWETRHAEAFPQQIRTMDVDYTLELDASGHIIGGEWRQSQRPDFIWTQRANLFHGYFEPLKEVYERSISK